MNIQQQNGIVSTIQFTPYVENEEYQCLRKSLFEQAMLASSISPINSIDVFDETIMVFENHHQALHFLIQVFRAAVILVDDSNMKIKLKSSLCEGNYFVRQDQIYGDAVNLATKLSCTSRQNELRVCNIDKQIIDDFISSQGDVAYFMRDHDENCVSIAFLDADSTNANIEHQAFQVEFNGQTKQFEASRNCKITVGRSDSSDIIIVNDNISRSHATITLNFGDVYVEDHSSNGTYLFFNNREVFLNNESKKIGMKGQISCGLNRKTNGGSSDIISFKFCDLSK